MRLADILSELPPCGFIYEFFKRFIRPYLLSRKLSEHVLFMIYKENYFVPWLKENPAKAIKFEGRLQ